MAACFLGLPLRFPVDLVIGEHSEASKVEARLQVIPQSGFPLQCNFRFTRAGQRWLEASVIACHANENSFAWHEDPQ